MFATVVTDSGQIAVREQWDHPYKEGSSIFISVANIVQTSVVFVWDNAELDTLPSAIYILDNTSIGGQLDVVSRQRQHHIMNTVLILVVRGNQLRFYDSEGGTATN